MSGFSASATALKRPWFHILVSLSASDRHGLDIARDVLDQTEGSLRLWPASLYGALNQLTDLGLITALSEQGEHPIGESEQRRFYRISPAGRRAVQRELHRLEAAVSAARARVYPRGARSR